jgi:hypothetical protein
MLQTHFAPCPKIVNANNKNDNKYDKSASMGMTFMQNFSPET